MTTKSINIALTQQEFDALYAESQRSLRHPRDQARYLLRNALFGNPEVSEMNNRQDTMKLSPQCVKAVGA